MSKEIGPYPPSPGWLLRWPRQAFGLVIATPGTLIVFVVAVFCIGLLIGPFTLETQSQWMFILMTAVGTTMALPLVVHVHCGFLRADGYSAPTLRDIPALSRGGVRVMLPLSAAFMAFSLYLNPAIMSLWSGIPNFTETEMVFREGLRAVMNMHVTAVIVNPLWVALIASLGMGAQEARLTSTQMMMRMTPFWIGIVGFTVLLMFRLLAMPPMIVLPVLYFFMAWSYVAAREIFGGISGEDERRTKATPVEARVS